MRKSIHSTLKNLLGGISAAWSSAWLSRQRRGSFRCSRDQANRALTRVNEFANFDIANFNGNVVQWRDGKANDLREAYDGFANNLMQPISFLAARRTDFQALEIEAKRVIAEIKKERESLLEALQGAKADAE